MISILYLYSDPDHYISVRLIIVIDLKYHMMKDHMIDFTIWQEIKQQLFKVKRSGILDMANQLFLLYNSHALRRDESAV